MEKKVIKRSDWTSRFYLMGTPKIDKEKSFKTNQKSNGSDWIYNSMGLSLDCGEKHGNIWIELMGGYDENKETKIYAHGKKENGSDDFDKQIVVDWNDRFNESILEEIGDLSFISVGLEKTSKGNVFVKKFLSAYDAIEYIEENLTPDMTILVSGNIKYQKYNNELQIKKNITKIELSDVTDKSQYYARFTQSILIDKDSASLRNVDKDKGVMYIDARVLDYVKEVNGVEVKGQYPYNKQFEFELDLTNEQLCKAVYEKVFKVKKGITQINFEGEFIESGATVMPTLDDIDDKIKSLIGVVYTEEEALAACVSKGKNQRRMVLKKPQIKLVGEEKTPILQVFEERYEEDDLVLDYLFKDVESNDEVPFNEDTEVDSMDWLNQLS